MERRRRWRSAAVVVLGVICTACASTPMQPPSGLPTSAATGTPASAAASASATPVRVVVIVMENRGYSSVIGLPYIRTIATPATTLTDYHAAGHPSVPNYLALTSGTTWGITDDGYHVLPQQDLGDQLTAAGVSWRAYMEGVGADCRVNAGRYAVKHDPFAYYGGRCPASVVPLGELATDLAGSSAPRFMWITPDLCHDMHDCSSSVGDAWLSGTVPSILSSPAMGNGVVFVTWDENEGGDSNQVLTVVLGARRPVTPSAPSSHAALLATVGDLLGLPRLPATRGVAAIALR